MEKTIDTAEGESLLMTPTNKTNDAEPANGAQSTEMYPSDNNSNMESIQAQKWPQFLAASAVNLAAVTAGLALGWPSPGSAKLKDLNLTPLSDIITKEQESWIGSLVALGAALGPLPAGIACDRLGRKMTLLIATIPFIVSWFIISTTCNITQIYAARFLMGTGVGAIFTALPMYIGEIADDSMRGALGSFLQLFITMGLLLAYALGPYISFFWLAIVCLAFPVVFVSVFVIFPDSPSFLLSVGKREEAKDALKKLRGLNGEALEKEIQVIQNNVDEAMRNKGSFKDITKNKGNFKALLLSLGLVTGQQLSGINVVLFYTENIFGATGTTDPITGITEPPMPAEISTIIIGVVQVLSSGLTPFVVERLGRRLLLLISATGMALALCVLGTYFYLLDNKYDVSGISFLPVASLVVYMIVYCIGFGPLPWAVMGELFPANIKSSASTATAAFCWFVGFLITKFFSNIADVIKMSGAFWMFSAFSIVAGLFVFKFLPETKGKSFQEIQDELNGNTSQ